MGTTATADMVAVAPDQTMQPLLVIYFDVATCPECKKVRDVLPQLSQKWGQRISLEVRDVAQMEALDDLFVYADHYGKDVEAPPRSLWVMWPL